MHRGAVHVPGRDGTIVLRFDNLYSCWWAKNVEFDYDLAVVRRAADGHRLGQAW
jgi:hypothetical protein